LQNGGGILGALYPQRFKIRCCFWPTHQVHGALSKKSLRNRTAFARRWLQARAVSLWCGILHGASNALQSELLVPILVMFW